MLALFDLSVKVLVSQQMLSLRCHTTQKLLNKLSEILPADTLGHDVPLAKFLTLGDLVPGENSLFF